MWIEQTANGKYKACERYIDPISGKTKKASITIEKDTKAARKAAQQALTAKIEKLQRITKTITIGELTDKYLEYKKDTVKPSTYRVTEQCGNFFKATFGSDAIVQNLTAGYVFDKIKDNSKTKGMANVRIMQFKAMIRWAYKHDYIQTKDWADKIDSVIIKKVEKPIKEMYLERIDLQKFLSGIDNAHVRLLSEFLALSGLRIGEALALLDADVDGTYIHVTKTYDSVLHETMDSPKTETSFRDVFIQPELRSTIKKVRLYRELLYPNFTPADLFFPQAMCYDQYRRLLASYSQKILGRTVTPHMLRHTHVSLLAEQGVPLEAISRRLGHNRTTITREIYLHITSGQKEKDNEAVGAVRML